MREVREERRDAYPWIGMAFHGKQVGRACCEDVGKAACDGGLCGAVVEQEGQVFAGSEGRADADEGTSEVVDELGGDDRMRKSRAFGVYEGRCRGRECRSEERSVGERTGWDR